MDEHQILEQAPFLQNLLLRLGVSKADLPDLLQEIVWGAWSSMTAGRFRPAPDRPLEKALRAWLTGIAWRKVSHYRDRAYRRREVSSGLVWDLIDTNPLPDEELAIEAMLRVIWRLPRKYRRILWLVALGFTMAEISEQLQIPIGTVGTRIRWARRFFLRGLARGWRYR